ncbi:MAG: UDP-N-acetylmuramate dehydrogenase [Clostridia bacterium]|nr:UDP-N-acetylmuramate dehydrogenase [Clostridia bacterium]
MQTVNFNEVKEKLYGIDVKENANVGALTRYGTGGNANLLITPKSTSELVFTINALKGVCPYAVIGNGSNLLVSDKGYYGAVITTKLLTKTELKGNLLIAECGAKLSDLVKECALNSLSGLEFATGIPATVGGAISMNAGCYGKTISDNVLYVVTENGTVKKADCGFSYRQSRFLGGETVIKACFLLIPSEYDQILKQIETYKTSRKNPKGRSCGSVFKNDGYYAGKVIDECGLKGYKVGGARVSSEHANFIIADNGATSLDIYELISKIKSKVSEKRQITLFEELVYLGEF